MKIVAWLSILITGAAGAVEWDVMKAGARGDGTSDDTAIFQQLLDEAGKAGGGEVFAPAGQYRIDGHLKIPAAVTLKGVFSVPPTTRHEGSPNLHGTVLLAYAGRGSTEGEPFIRLAGHMAVLKGVIITYPEWKQTDVPPVPYPPCVLAEGVEDTGVFDCCLINPYEGLRFVQAPRYLVRNVFGYPSWRGFFVDECYDIGKVENCHFWPFGVAYNPEDPYCKWVNTQGVAYEFARTDWNYVTHTFCFGYGVGYKFSESRTGSCNGSFVGIGADCCTRAVRVEQCQDPGLLITNGEFVGRWSSQDSVCVEIAPGSDGKISMVNCSFWGPNDLCILHRSPTAQTTASACNFVHWDVNNHGSPCIQADEGKIIVESSTFGAGSLHVRVGEKVRSAILMGNQAGSGFRVENFAGRKTIETANEPDPIDWTGEALTHYVLRLGTPGDGRYLRNWFGPETSGQDSDVPTWRWSREQSEFVLPIQAGIAYEGTLRLEPPRVETEASGLYLGGERIAGLKGNSVVFQLPPQESDRVTLTLKTKGWKPAELIQGSGDDRLLGVQVYEIKMKSGQPGSKVFFANNGEWIEQ